jgi:hypothetical protein
LYNLVVIGGRFSETLHDSIVIVEVIVASMVNYSRWSEMDLHDSISGDDWNFRVGQPRRRNAQEARQRAMHLPTYYITTLPSLVATRAYRR